MTVPYVVEAAVFRMLAYDEDARFQSAGQVADALAGVAWAHGYDEGRGWLAENARDPVLLEEVLDGEGDEATRPMRRSMRRSMRR